ncbi:MAG: AEC family transporter [Sphaerochaeta sp.]|jgi:predicted permease|uniref:AEC family transporter n=1 Tax=Sphaerochaeta sp. TaxID=1972642 RepID=UPI0016B5BA71|nr:AEC family transporter [Sphaerochaeta sp.]MDD3929634.1 AEC family transporter [Sphaerochaeta sp.]NLK05537.1 AEC family transporter [Spirochaetales bacterium]
MLSIVLEKIGIMFLILALGVICLKKGIFDEALTKRLSTFLLQVVNPAVIFVSYQITYSHELLVNLGYSFALSFAAFLLQILVAALVIRKKSVNAAVEKLSIIYSNCGFFGIPLANGLFGREGVFYLTGYLTVFYLFFWTHGVILMIGRSGVKETAKNLFSPAIVGVVLGFLTFILRIPVPTVIVQALDSVGGMNTPLAMLVAGATLAQSNLLSCFTNPRIYLVSFHKLILVPLAVALAFMFLPLNPVMLLTIIIASACPVGASCTMFALRYGKDSIYASQLFIVSTLLAIISIPLVVTFSNLIGIVV